MYQNPYWQGGYENGDQAGWVAAMLGCFTLMSILLIILYLWLFYRIFKKAGYSGWLTLLNLIPYIGTVIVLFILALGDWPVLRGYGGRGQTPPAEQSMPPAQTYQPSAPAPPPPVQTYEPAPGSRQAPPPPPV